MKKENKKNNLTSLLKILILLIIILILGWAFWWVWNLLKYQPQPSQKPLQAPQESEAFKKLQDKLELGNPVSADEPGYGRDDPFAGI